MTSTPTFGEQFLDEVRALLGANPLDYAATQRVKAMDREQVIEVLRQQAGATYAEIQRFKRADDPRELARFLYEAQQRKAAQAGSFAFFALWMGIS